MSEFTKLKILLVKLCSTWITCTQCEICQHLLLAPSEICESLECLCFQRILNFGTSWPTFIKTQHLSFVQTDHNTVDVRAYICLLRICTARITGFQAYNGITAQRTALYKCKCSSSRLSTTTNKQTSKRVR